MDSVLVRKVQLTREEFVRQLPDAVGDMEYHVDGEDILIGAGSRLVRVNLSDLGIDNLGSLKLPTQLHFRFENMAKSEVEHFMNRWDEHKLRKRG